MSEGLTDADRARRRAWLDDMATTLHAPHLARVPMVAIVQRTGEIVGATAAAQDLVGAPLTGAVADLVERGTVSRPDFERLLERARGRHGDGRPASEVEHAEAWSDDVTIHRDGDRTTVQLHVLHHWRPGLREYLVVITLLPASTEPPAAGAPRREGDDHGREELWSVIDGQGRVLALDGTWTRVWAEPDRLLGSLVAVLCHPEDVAEVLPLVSGLYTGDATSATYTIRLAADGGRWVPVHVEQRALRTAAGDVLVVSTHRIVDSWRELIFPGDLTRREAEVVAALFDGIRVPTIAERHGVSVHTVRNQLRSVYRKLGATGQADLLSRFHRPVTS